MENNEQTAVGVSLNSESVKLVPVTLTLNMENVEGAAIGLSPNLEAQSPLKTRPHKSVKRQGSLSIQNKLAIFNAVDKGDKKKCEVAEDFGIATSTLSTILKQRSKIMAVSKDANLDRKRLRLPQYADIDKGLAEWCRKAQSEGVKLNGAMVCKKARELAAEMNSPKFSCSNGWMERFKKRHGLSFSKTIERRDLLQHIQTEDDEGVLQENNTEFAEVIANYKPCDVFCVLPFTLFWSALPSHSFHEMQTHLKEHNQEHVAVILASNMDGSKKLPLRVIIDKSGQTLSSLMNVRTKCPVQYTYGDGAVLTPDIFIQWIQHIDTSLDMENRRVCFLVEQSDMFPKVKGLRAIQLLHLPKGNAHPCLQCIAQYLKITYRLRLIEHLSGKSEENKDKSISLTLIDALTFLHEKWKALPVEIIQQAFNRAGFVLQVQFSTMEASAVFSPEQTLTDAELSRSLNRLVDKIRTNTNLPANVEKACLNLGIECFGAVDQGLEKKYQENTTQSAHNEMAPPTTRQANEALDTLKRFFDSQCISNASIAGHVKESVGILENAIRVMSDF